MTLSALPARGETHNDQLIWDMVGFLQALPKMNPDHDEAAVASAAEDHEVMKDMNMDHAAEKPAGETGAHAHDGYAHSR